MITLYTFGPYFGQPDPSPFVYKAMALLKIAQLPFATQVVMSKNLGKAPKGKLPYLTDEGEIIADSTFIRWHIEKKYGYDFERNMTPYERGTAWALEKMLEDNVYWLMVKARWMDDANFAKGPAHFFDALPWPIRNVVIPLVRKKVRSNLFGQGMGRYSPSELLAIATKDLEAVSAILVDKPYLFGDQPSGADATALAFIDSVLCPHFESPARRCAESHPNLVAYVERMKKQYFPDV
jgi:glutathione S-transferase